MVRWKLDTGKPVVDFLIRLNWTFFAIYYTVPELLGWIFTDWHFSQGPRLLCTQILPGHGRPPSAILGLPNGEDRIPLRSLVLTQYRNVTDGRTDNAGVWVSMRSSCPLNDQWYVQLDVKPYSRSSGQGQGHNRRKIKNSNLAYTHFQVRVSKSVGFNDAPHDIIVWA